jgi:hypothetical protein
MEAKHLKDFVIAMVVIAVFALGFKLVFVNQKIDKIPLESRFKKMALSEQLLSQIEDIEESIQDRKDFVFAVVKDPLEQNLVVKTKKDLEKQWQEEVANMVRLETTIIPQSGEKLATISYQGKSQMYRIGDTFIKGKIKDIKLGEIVYSYEGMTKTLQAQKIPTKPRELTQKSNSKKNRELNW